jgi:hypothetical protein
VHDAHRSASSFAGLKLIDGTSPGAVENGRAWLQIWGDRAGYDFDGVIGDCEDDRVGSSHARAFPSVTGRDDVV